MTARKLGKILAFAAAGLLLLAAVSLFGIELALERVPAYQREIKGWVHQQTGFYVRFAHVAPALRWYGPELSFRQLELRSKDDRRILAQARRGRIGLDVWRLILSGKLFAGRVELDAPDIVLARIGPASFALASEIKIDGANSSAAKLTLDDLPTGILLIRGGRVTIENWNASLPQLVLNGVDFAMRRDAGAITAGFAGRLPRVLGGELNVTAAARGLGDLNTLTWTAAVRTRDISFRGWRLLLPDYLSNLESGSGEFEFAARGRGRDLARADFDFAARDVRTRSSAGAAAEFDRISGNLTLTHAANSWTLDGERMLASRSGRVDPPAQFTVAWRGDAAGLTNLSAHASYLRADALLPLAGLLRRPALRDRLIEISPSGEWFDAKLRLSRTTPAAPWAFQVRARFRGIGFAPLGAAPGLKGLTGTIAGDQDGGHVTLESTRAALLWPREWPQPAALSKLEGTFYWKRTAADLLIATPELLAQNPDAAVRLQAALQYPATGEAPLLTLVGRIEGGNVADARDYLPRAQLHPKTYAWLDTAFTAGRLTRADVILRGPLRHFPFRDGSGLFLARAHLDGITLNYHKAWPPITDASAVAVFRNQGLALHLLGASAGGVRIAGGDAQFADFKDGELQVHADATNDAAAVLQFLSATPLDRMAGRAFSSVRAKGPVSMRINLFLPLQKFDQRRILVHASISGVTLSRPGLPLIATGLTGLFVVDGAQVARADIDGRLLGGTFRVRARAPRHKPVTHTQLDFRGVLDGDALRAAIGLPARAEIHGTANWRAVLKMAPEPARERSLRVTTNLAGLDIGLPQPFAKPSARSLPSWLQIDWPVDGGPLVNGAIGAIVRATLALRPAGGGATIAHAAIEFGAAEPVFSDTQIFSIGGRIDQVDLAGWRDLYGASKNGPPLSTYLRTARLRVGAAYYHGLALRDLALDLAADRDHWRLGIHGPSTDGTITSPRDGAAGAPWDLRFGRLGIVEAAGPGAAANGAAAPSITPRNFPAIRFHARQLHWVGRKLGDVQATVSQADQGVSLDHLTMKGGTFSVDAHGDWRGEGVGTGHIIGSLISSDVAATLTELGYAKVIAAQQGSLAFDLQWAGAPSADALRDSTGQVRVALDKGQVFGIKPGAGRMLGLASVAALPRRLALDFSDLTDKGLAFDTVRGDFKLRGGDAYTDNILLKGPAAEIGLIGRIGLKNKDYDQIAVVTGSFGNSLPLAGALAGGPVVGAAVLLFTQVFKQPLKGLARGYYRITGGWDNPIVERITSADALSGKMEVPK